MDDSDDEETCNWADEPDAIEAVRVARDILAETTPVVQGCRRLWKALKELCYEDDAAFAAIALVTGKSAEYPMPEDRHLWVPVVAAAKGAEFDAWLSSIRPEVMAACKETVRRFGGAG